MEIQNLVIAGGGTAGWMTAAMAIKLLPFSVTVELIESEQIGIIGVGEATIPPIRNFNNVLGLDERDFMRETNSSIKLAIKFENWRVQGESYFHTFGAPGAQMGFCGFNHFWERARSLGDEHSLWDYDLNYLFCEQNGFEKLTTQNPIYEVPYAYHFDANLYAQYLRKISEKAGVIRTEGVIGHVSRNTESGYVEALHLESGEIVKGDLFIDCTGTRSLLSQETLGVSYESWSDLLPANSAVAVQTEREGVLAPYTRSIAHPVGWQWQIPLSDRVGSGVVYSDRYISDDEAAHNLLQNIPGKCIKDPRIIRFQTGRLSRQWTKNVIAVGLSSGFLEPLESTSIHLIQSAVVRLFKLFPKKQICPQLVSKFNRESKEEFETIRDFILLHYVVNERQDSRFWIDMRNLEIPERLRDKVRLYRETGVILQDPLDIFRDSSWLQVMMGQGIRVESYHPLANKMSDREFLSAMAELRKAKRGPVRQLMSQEVFLDRYLYGFMK